MLAKFKIQNTRWFSKNKGYKTKISDIKAKYSVPSDCYTII